MESKNHGVPLVDHSKWPDTSWAEATAIKAHHERKDVYLVDIKPDWVVGIGEDRSNTLSQVKLTEFTVPHGGYLASLMTLATQRYFSDHQPSLPQPDPISAHVEFLGRSVPGPAVIQITVLKIGRQFSTVRATLARSLDAGNVSIEALITQGNLRREENAGELSLPTKPIIEKQEIYPRTACREIPKTDDMSYFGRAFGKIRLFLPEQQLANNKILNWKHPVYGPSVRDQWITWDDSTGEKLFTVQSIPLLVDLFRPPASQYDNVNKKWYPTLNMGFEIKKAPPAGEEGWKWLYMRIHMTVALHGRYGLDITLLDEAGEVVALSRHVALIVGVERNTKVKSSPKI